MSLVNPKERESKRSQTSDSQPERRSLNLPLAYVGESNSSRRLREENRRIVSKRKFGIFHSN